MKKFGLFAISLLIAMFAFTSCKKPSASSVEIKIDGKDGVIYTTVPYSDIEIKVSFDSAVNDDYETANIDDFMFRVLPADNESMEDIDPDKYVALTASGLKATLESDKKTITFTNNTDQDVKFTTDTAIGVGKIMILANPDIFPEGTTKLGVISGANKIKDRTATVTKGTEATGTVGEAFAEKELTVKLDGTTFLNDVEADTNLSAFIKIKTTDSTTALTNTEFEAVAKSDVAEGANTLTIKLTCKVEDNKPTNAISGTFVISGDAIEGDDLVLTGDKSTITINAAVTESQDD